MQTRPITRVCVLLQTVTPTLGVFRPLITNGDVCADVGVFTNGGVDMGAYVITNWCVNKCVCKHKLKCLVQVP